MLFASWSGKDRTARPRRLRAVPLRLEVLEDRTLPSTFDVIGTSASYLASSGIVHHITLSQVGSLLVLTDTGEKISLGPGAKALGCTGGGTSTILCPAGTIAAVSLDTVDGRDSVTVKPLGLTPAVLVRNDFGLTDLTVDDSADPTATHGIITCQGPTGAISGSDPSPVAAIPGVPNPAPLAPLVQGGIQFAVAQLGSLTVDGGSGGNYFAVEGTAPTCTTTLNCGPGQNIVEVRATLGALTVNGQGGRDRVNVGLWDPFPLSALDPTDYPPGGTLSLIQGPVTVSNQGSLTDLTVNDDGDVHSAAFDLFGGKLSNSTAADIAFAAGELNSLTVKGGRAGNLFTVHDTPAGVPTTLDTGSGYDVVNVLRTSGPLEVFDANGPSTVNAAVPHVEHVITQAPISPISQTAGSLDSPDEESSFPLIIPSSFVEGGELSVQVVPQGGSQLDSRVALYSVSSFLIDNGAPSAGGGLLASSDDTSAGDPNPSLEQNILPGIYFVLVSSGGQGASATGAYTLSVSFTPRADPYHPPARTMVGTDPQDIDVGDFTENGFADLAVANHGSSTEAGSVSVLLGNGDGTFQPAIPIPLPAGEHADGLLAVDVNNDGRPDLLVWDKTNHQVYTLLGTGDGHFLLRPGALSESAAEVLYPRLFNDPTRQGMSLLTGTPIPTRLVTADFNRDGIPGFAQLVPNGDGTFADYLHVAVGIDPQAKAVIDYPPLTDFIGGPFPVGNIITTQEAVFTEFNPPSPPRNTPLVLDDGGLPAVVEVDRTGQILLRVQTTDPADGSLTFSPPTIVEDPTSARPQVLAREIAVVGDDPMHPEIAGISIGVGEVFVYRGTVDAASHRITWQRTFDQLTGPLFVPTGLAVGDLDGDGLPDLVVASSLEGNLAIYHNDGAGLFHRALDLKPGGFTISDVLLSDPTRTGHANILVTDQVSGNAGIFVNQAWPPGTLGFADEVRIRGGLPPGGSGVTESTLSNIAQNYAPEFQSLPTLYSTFSSLDTATAVVGDFTGDGVPDLVVLNRGTNNFTLLQGKEGPGGAATGTFIDPQAGQTWATGADPGAIVAGDFGNGHLDLAILNQGDDTISVFLGDGHGHFTPAFATDSQGNPLALGAGASATGLSLVRDDQTGFLDLLVGNPFGDVLRLVGNGDGTFAPAGKRVSLDVAPDLLGPAQPGVLLADQQSSAVTVQAATAGGSAFVPVQTLSNPAAPLAPGAVSWYVLDRNSTLPDAVVIGSGSNDVVVYRTTGVPDGVPTFAPDPRTYPVGTDPTSVTFADLNGDGIPDMLVANEGSNDVSVIFGSYDSSGNWVGTAGPRLKSAGSGPLAATLVSDPGSPGGHDLAIVNQDGTADVLAGRGEGFFDDRSPRVLDLGQPLAQVSFSGSAGFAAAADGQVLGFDLATFTSSGIAFTPPAGRAVEAVEALSASNFLVAEEGGTVEDPPLGETFTSLDGTPDAPSALQVLQTPAGEQVLLTSAGLDKVFVFTLLSPEPAPPPGELPPPEAPETAAGFTFSAVALEEGSFVVVVTVVADTLPEGSGGTSTAQLIAAAQQAAPGGGDADTPAGEAVAAAAPATGPAWLPGGIDDVLPDLSRPTDEPRSPLPLSQAPFPDALPGRGPRDGDALWLTLGEDGACLEPVTAEVAVASLAARESADWAWLEPGPAAAAPVGPDVLLTQPSGMPSIPAARPLLQDEQGGRRALLPFLAGVGLAVPALADRPITRRLPRRRGRSLARRGARAARTGPFGGEP
jgi:hypothetical protein